MMARYGSVFLAVFLMLGCGAPPPPPPSPDAGEWGSTTCGPSNCDGCCEGNLCRPGTLNSACGVRGGRCIACASNETCSAGVCTSSGGGSGYDAGGGGGGGSGYDAGGGGGGGGGTSGCRQHTDCADDTQLCIDGRCVTGFYRTYRLTLVSANILATRNPETGLPWDIDGTPPDPYACLYVNGMLPTNFCGLATTPNTYMPVFNKTWELTPAPGDNLVLSLGDVDLDRNGNLEGLDTIERVELRDQAPIVIVRIGGRVSFTVAGGIVDYTLTATLLR